LPTPIEGLAVQPFDAALLLQFLRTQEFKGLIGRIENRQRGTAAEAAVAEAPRPSNEPIVAERAPEQLEYVTVSTVEALGQWVAAALQKGIVALDTETTSGDPMRAELIGVSLSLKPGRACYIPVGHMLDGLLADRANMAQQLDRDRVLDKLKPLLEDPSVLKVGHNIKPD